MKLKKLLKTTKPTFENLEPLEGSKDNFNY